MKALTIFSLLVLFSSYAMAQESDEEIKPMKYENVVWYEVVMVDYKPGQVDEAKKYMEKFFSAAEISKTPTPQIYWVLTGEYDAMIVWELDGGPSDLEWRFSPSSVEWYKALIEQEGSKEGAEEVSKGYASTVSKSSSFISMKEK